MNTDRWLSLFIIASSLAPLCLLAYTTQELSGVDSLNVGTPFTFTIRSDNGIDGISIPDTLESFSVISSKQGKDNKTWELLIAPLKTGALSFPRLSIQKMGSTGESDSTDAFRVYVLSVIADGDTLLRDIKPLERYFLQPGWWVYLVFVIIGLLLAVYLLIHRKRKPPKASVLPAPAIPKAIPAWEIAITELEALLAENLVEKGEVLAYHFRISEILRRFLETTYHFPALEMTGSEINAYITKHNISRYNELRSMINHFDMVKFAKAEPVVYKIQQEADWLNNYFVSFVRKA